MASKVRIDVSAEMVSYVGAGPLVADWPVGWVVARFDGVAGGGPATLSIVDRDDDFADALLVFAIDPRACRRLFGFVPRADECWHLSSDLRAIALAIHDCPLVEPARETLRLAKSIELFCAVMMRLEAETLVPAVCGGALSQEDAARIFAARRLIDERWREKLTLDGIARSCGINRAKLTRGFRALFACSVVDALAENRLGGAQRMLRETDLPVASIGYACGYHNNASFARAFARRYGMAPSRVRQPRIAAGPSWRGSTDARWSTRRSAGCASISERMT